MSRGPLRRLTGAAGLLALAPTGYLLAAGSVAPSDAAVRAAGTLAGILVLGRLADRGIAGLLRTYERVVEPDGDDDDAPADEPVDRRAGADA